jgi:hypothetical protein
MAKPTGSAGAGQPAPAAVPVRGRPIPHPTEKSQSWPDPGDPSWAFIQQRDGTVRMVELEHDGGDNMPPVEHGEREKTLAHTTVPGIRDDLRVFYKVIDDWKPSKGAR